CQPIVLGSKNCHTHFCKRPQQSIRCKDNSRRHCFKYVTDGMLTYAISIILCHNHVSGGSKPDKADQDLTKKIAAAARTMDIKVLDHIIIGENDHYSFADEGNL